MLFHGDKLALLFSLREFIDIMHGNDANSIVSNSGSNTPLQSELNRATVEIIHLRDAYATLLRRVDEQATILGRVEATLAEERAARDAAMAEERAARDAAMAEERAARDAMLAMMERLSKQLLKGDK